MATVVQQRQSLTLGETAERMHVSEKTVRRLVARRELPAFRVGSLIRVDASELEAWIAGPARNDAA